jgi:hypothetical protein
MEHVSEFVLVNICHAFIGLNRKFLHFSSENSIIFFKYIYNI